MNTVKAMNKSAPMTPSELSAIRVECAEARGWKLVPEGSRNPPPISFRLCPICGYYGAIFEGRQGMAPLEEGSCPESHEKEWVSAFDQWTLDGKECEELPAFDTDANAALTLAKALADEGWDMKHSKKASQTDHLVKFEMGYGSGYRNYLATAPTFALALCQAYLAVHRNKKA